MATAHEHHNYTVEEYLSYERGIDGKHEFFDGNILAMVGASEAHVLIVGNLATVLNLRLQERDCRVYANDMKLKIAATGLFTYPDLMVACGEVEFEDDRRDILLNPSVVIEVLSPSTEAYDRGAKFAHYRQVDSLCEYLLVSQLAPCVECYSRQPDGEWVLTECDSLGEAVVLQSISCELPLSDIYRKIKFND